MSPYKNGVRLTTSVCVCECVCKRLIELRYVCVSVCLCVCVRLSSIYSYEQGCLKSLGWIIFQWMKIGIHAISLFKFIHPNWQLHSLSFKSVKSCPLLKSLSIITVEVVNLSILIKLIFWSMKLIFLQLKKYEQ
jgi:hypothetical protein